MDLDEIKQRAEELLASEFQPHWENSYALARDVFELCAEIGRLAHEAEQNELLLADWPAAEKQLRAEIERLRAQIADVGAEHAGEASERDKAEAEVERLRIECQGLRDHFDGLARQRDRAEAEVERLRKLERELTGDLLAAGKLLRTTQAEVERLRETLQAADDLLAGMWSFNEQGRAGMLKRPTYWLQASEVIREALGPPADE